MLLQELLQACNGSNCEQFRHLYAKHKHSIVMTYPC
jgi:hypothetical protein